MSRQIVNEEEFIMLCNQALQNHPDFKQGMEIIGVPEDVPSKDMSGYNWKGPDGMEGMVSKIVSDVSNKYELRVTR